MASPRWFVRDDQDLRSWKTIGKPQPPPKRKNRHATKPKRRKKRKR
jgi:hypothetical protein